METNGSRDLLTPDSVLLERVAAGEERARWELCARHGATLYALAYSILRNEAEAEEVVRQAFREVRYEAAQFDPSHFPVLRWLTELTRAGALELSRAH